MIVGLSPRPFRRRFFLLGGVLVLAPVSLAATSHHSFVSAPNWPFDGQSLTYKAALDLVVFFSSVLWLWLYFRSHHPRYSLYYTFRVIFGWIFVAL